MCFAMMWFECSRLVAMCGDAFEIDHARHEVCYTRVWEGYGVSLKARGEWTVLCHNLYQKSGIINIIVEQERCIACRSTYLFSSFAH